MEDPDPANVIFQLLLLLVLILLNAFFAMSEIAIISLNDTKVKRMAEEGDKRNYRVNIALFCQFLCKSLIKIRNLPFLHTHTLHRPLILYYIYYIILFSYIQLQF